MPEGHAWQVIKLNVNELESETRTRTLLNGKTSVEHCGWFTDFRSLNIRTIGKRTLKIDDVESSQDWKERKDS